MRNGFQAPLHTLPYPTLRRPPHLLAGAAKKGRWVGIPAVTVLVPQLQEPLAEARPQLLRALEQPALLLHARRRGCRQARTCTRHVPHQWKLQAG